MYEMDRINERLRKIEQRLDEMQYSIDNMAELINDHTAMILTLRDMIRMEHDSEVDIGLADAVDLLSEGMSDDRV